MKALRKYQKSIAFVLSGLLVLMSTGCNHYYRLEVNNGTFKKHPHSRWISESKFHFIHTKSGLKEIDSVYFDSETNQLKGQVLGEYDPAWNKLYKKARRDGELKGFNRGGAKRANQLHVFTEKMEVNSDSLFVIQSSDVYKVEKMYYDAEGTYQKRKLALGLGLGLGIPLGIAAVLGTALGIACNCPHVYVFNGQNFEMQTALFAGSIHPSLERRDYFVIQNYDSDESLKLQIRNEEQKKETQFLNDFKLKVIYHDPNLKIRTDRNGGIHSIQKTYSPEKVWSLEMVDLLPQVAKSDGEIASFTLNQNQNDLNQVFMNFFRPKGKKKAKLLFDASNTKWSGYVVDEFFQLFGSEGEKIQKRFDKTSKEQKLKWQKEQGLLLSVYVKRSGKWVFEDYLDLIGTGKNREFVLPIDLKNIQGDRIEVKLVSGFNFWQLDYAAIDFSENGEVESKDIAITQALFNGIEIDLESVFSDEEKYLILENRGDVLDLQFKQAPKQEGKKVTFLLSSKGYLKKYHDGSGKFNKSKLLSFAKKGEMSRFSMELMQIVNK